MDTTVSSTSTEPTADDTQAAPVAQAAPVVEQDLLVEDVSIDGMCGVY